MADEIMPEDEAPEASPDAAAYWHAQIKAAEKAFGTYQTRADNIDKLYADLEAKSKTTIDSDREFAMFWANIQVLGPSVYARPPVPVVVPRFKDRRPVPRVASELLERSTVVRFELEEIDEVMREVRDDLIILARGVAWVRLEGDGKDKKVCIDHKDRADFLHDPARKWKEVGWVAAAGHLTKTEMKKRFKKTSGDAYKDATYSIRKEAREQGAADDREKCKVWEIWSKDDDRVYWVTEGVDVLLDEDKPHLDLEGFYPCPKPAYATRQRGSLVPVPDVVYYRGQLEEINELTARIGALQQSLKVRGFYPHGASDIGEALESAFKITDDRQVMIPVSNFAAFGNGTAKDMIVWLPIDMIAQTLKVCVELRRQLIDDVYQITGLSDIMRGSTDPNETLGAQQLKSQYGSIRVRDKQNELVRMARDLARIVAEIHAEEFDQQILLDMAQMEIASDADIRKQVADLTKAGKDLAAQVQQAQQDPQMLAMAQQNPEEAQKTLAGAQKKLQEIEQKIQEVQGTPTIEQVMKLLREQRLRPFVLDIETDSTIQPDEQREKELRGEFLTALGGTMQQLGPLLETTPGAGEFAAEILRFAVAPYRAGRELDQAIESLIRAFGEKGGQDKPDPETIKAQAEAEALKQAQQLEGQKLQQQAQADQAKMQMEAQQAQAEQERKTAETRAKLEEIQVKAAAEAAAHQQKMEQDREAHVRAMDKASVDLQLSQAKLDEMKVRMAAQAQQADLNAQAADQSAEHAERNQEMAEENARREVFDSVSGGDD